MSKTPWPAVAAPGLELAPFVPRTCTLLGVVSGLGGSHGNQTDKVLMRWILEEEEDSPGGGTRKDKQGTRGGKGQGASLSGLQGLRQTPVLQNKCL